MSEDRPTPVPVLLRRGGAVIAAVAILAGCGPADSGADARSASAKPRAPASLHGEAARAVEGLSRALRDGDVERLCRPGAVFTPAVVAAMNDSDGGCEASLELSNAIRHPPGLTVTRLASEPGLATARVRVGLGSTIPLDLVRDGRRWLVSFSDGLDPVGVLQRVEQD